MTILHRPSSALVSLYGLLNQNYSRIGDRVYCYISLGAQSEPCYVDEKASFLVTAALIACSSGALW